MFRRFQDKYIHDNNWSKLERYIRIDGIPVNEDIGTRYDDSSEGHYYQNGLVIAKINDKDTTQYKIIASTLWGGKIVVNHSIIYNPDGTIDSKRGFVNCFGLGRMPMDEEYADEYWSELITNFNGWDTVTE